MFRKTMSGAIIGLVSLIGASTGWAQDDTTSAGTGTTQWSSQWSGQDQTQGSTTESASGTTYGVFREVNANVPVGELNCWTQAMVSGSTINGELLAQRATQRQAEWTLRYYARQGACANEVAESTWTTGQD